MKRLLGILSLLGMIGAGAYWFVAVPATAVPGGSDLMTSQTQSLYQDVSARVQQRYPEL